MPGRQHHDGRLARRGRGDVLQHLEQLLGIVLHRQDRQAVEHLREGPLHHLAVFQHVGDARGTAEVVFQHVDRAVGVAHQVGARDVAPDALGRLQAGAAVQKALARLGHVLGKDAVADDLLLVVHVVDEQVQRADPLLQPVLDRLAIPGTP